MVDSRWRLAAVLVCACVLGACGGGGGDGASDPVTAQDVVVPLADIPGDPGADGATDPGAEAVADVPADPGADPADDPGGLEDLVPSKCTPACSYADGRYCDEAAATCADIACTICWRDKDCAAGEVCLDHAFEGGAYLSVCSKACTTGADCAAGFACDAGAGRCVPKALCPVPACGGGQLGDPCEFKGTNVGCAACGEGLTCVGSMPAAEATCLWDRDCRSYGMPIGWNPDCANGACGRSYCSKPCSTGCPDGFDGVAAGLACWCVPVGTSPAGGECPIFGLHAEAEECGAKLTCLGVSATEETDACATTADCAPERYAGVPECLDGRCGSSFCSPKCAAGGTCDPGWYPATLSGTCFCIPRIVGTSQPGDPCPFGKVHPDAQACVAEATCLGIDATSSTTACTTDADCPVSEFTGNPTCVDGFCGASFCAAGCDASDKCGTGFMPIRVDTTCFCAPRVVGDAKPGDPCPFATVNADAEACVADAVCFGIPADTGGTSCATDADCPKSVFLGNPDCVAGICGTSFCASGCDEHARCGDGFQPYDIDGDCFCVKVEVGASTAFAACPFDDVNPTADACAAGLLCMGTALPLDAICATDADCAYTGADCVEGHCAFSFCAPYCDDAGACAAGEPFLLGGTGTCVCGPAPATGQAAAGDACPLGNAHLAADACATGLACTGLWAYDQAPECAIATDCPAWMVEADCFLGRCGFSRCLALCGGAACAGEATPLIEGAGGPCVCRALPAGSAAAGEPCAYANLGAEASCAAGLACVGHAALPGLSEACATHADCVTAGYRGVPECVSGWCGTSFCAAPCNAGACAEGFGPIEDAAGSCWCWPASD